MNYVITWTEALYAFFGTILFLISSGLVGSIITRKYISGLYTPSKLFLTLVCGMAFIVPVYAIWMTKGQTILLPVPLLLFLGLYYYKKDSSSEEHRTFSLSLFQWSGILIVFSALYFIFFLQIYLYETETFFSFPGADDIFYSRVIDYLNTYGIENCNGDFFFPHDIGVKPYHYFDLWIAAFISKIFGIKSVNALVLCSFSIFCVLTSLGILSLLNILFQKELQTWTLFLISALSGLFSGSKIFFPTFLLKADIFNIPVANYPKVALVAIFLILLLILAKKSLWNSFFIFATILSLSFINVLPAIFGSCVICILLFVFIFKEKSIIQIIPGFLTLILGLCYIPAFYTLFKVDDPTSIVLPSNYFKMASSVLNVKSLKTAINIFVGGGFQFLLLLPFIIIGCWIYIRKYPLNLRSLKNLISFNNILLNLFIFPLSGLVSWAILFKVSSNSVQFYHNIIIPFFGIFIAIIMAYCFASNWRYRILACIFLIIMVSTNFKYDNHKATFDKKEWRSLNSFVQPLNGLLGNFRGNKDSQTSIALIPLVSQPLDVLYFKLPNYNNASLTSLIIYPSKDNIYIQESYILLEQTPLSRYSRQLHKDVKRNDENVQLAFFDKFNIKYISVSKYANLPAKIKLQIIDSINLPNAGWRVYQLKDKK